MFQHPHARYYPTSVRINGQPYTIMSDEDLLLNIRWTGGDDLHDLVQARLKDVEELPDPESVKNAIERIRTDASDVVSALETLYDQFDQ